MGVAVDWDALLARITAETPPTTTVYLRLFRNSPEDGSPVVLRLLTGAQDELVRQAVGKLPNDDEKAGAWIREPLMHALVSIDGITVPEDLNQRQKLLAKLPSAVIAELFRAYQVLDADELAAQQAVVDAAHDPNASGAGSGS